MTGRKPLTRAMILAASLLVAFALACNKTGSSGTGRARAGQDGAKLTAVVPALAVRPGQPFSFRLALTNAGTTSWTDTEGFGPGRRKADAPMATPPDLSLDAGETIAPGETRAWTVRGAAPLTPGTYRQTWQMRRTGPDWFGDQATLEVRSQSPRRRRRARP